MALLRKFDRAVQVVLQHAIKASMLVLSTQVLEIKWRSGGSSWGGTFSYGVGSLWRDVLYSGELRGPVLHGPCPAAAGPGPAPPRGACGLGLSH